MQFPVPRAHDITVQFPAPRTNDITTKFPARYVDYGPGTVPILPAPLVPARPIGFLCKEIARLGTLNKNLRYSSNLRVPQKRAPLPPGTQICAEEISRVAKYVFSHPLGSGVAMNCSIFSAKQSR